MLLSLAGVITGLNKYCLANASVGGAGSASDLSCETCSPGATAGLFSSARRVPFDAAAANGQSLFSNEYPRSVTVATAVQASSGTQTPNSFQEALVVDLTSRFCETQRHRDHGGV